MISIKITLKEFSVGVSQKSWSLCKQTERTLAKIAQRSEMTHDCDEVISPE